jgi:hypothetical protein
MPTFLCGKWFDLCLFAEISEVRVDRRSAEIRLRVLPASDWPEPLPERRGEWLRK